MANICIVCGTTTAGKSYSIKNLDPKQTVVISVKKGKLPFKSKDWSEENKNFFKTEDRAWIMRLMTNISEKCPNCKTIIIDDADYLMRNEYFARADERGYGVFKDLAVHFQEVIHTAETLRDDINVFMLMHIEPVFNGSIIETYKLATVGKMLDEKYNPFELVNVVLFCTAEYVNDKLVHRFITNAAKYNDALVPAKSPEGMFEDIYIENDLNKVIEAMNNY